MTTGLPPIMYRRFNTNSDQPLDLKRIPADHPDRIFLEEMAALDGIGCGRKVIVIADDDESEPGYEEVDDLVTTFRKVELGMAPR